MEPPQPSPLQPSPAIERQQRYAAGSPLPPVPGPDGWVLFASTMVLFTGLFNAFDGLFAFFRSSYFIGHAVFGDLWIWALLWLGFGILQMSAGGAILAGRSWGRWFAIVVVAINVFVHLLALAIYPFWSFVIIAFDIAIIYGLTVHWSKPVQE